jgi:hypothetical protein
VKVSPVKLLSTIILCLTVFLGWTKNSEPVETEDGAAQFLPDGRLSTLTLTGENLIRETRLRNGFSMLLFNGSTVREIPLTRVTRKGNGWLIQGEQDFPRFTCTFEAGKSGISLRLLRIEGVPAGKDSTLVFTLGSQKPLQASGKGAESETLKDALRIYWPFIGATNALENAGPVLIGLQP